MNVSPNAVDAYILLSMLDDVISDIEFIGVWCNVYRQLSTIFQYLCSRCVQDLKRGQITILIFRFDQH